MEYKVLPPIYANQQRRNDDEYERQKEEQLAPIVEKKIKEYDDKADKYNKKAAELDLGPDGFDTYKAMICVGVGILLFITVIGLVIITVYQDPPHTDNFAVFIVVGIICSAILGVLVGTFGAVVCGSILTIVLSPIAYPIFRGVCSYKMKKAKEKAEEIKKEKTKAVEKIWQPILAEIEQRKRETEHRITQYTEGFEQEAQKLSVNFANSTLAKEVVEWLAAGFLKKVKAADRASHIEKIVIPFYFDVEEGEISRSTRYNIDRYNFEEHRCERLQDALARAALARAIASQVQLNMTTQYDKDASGTEYKIDIEYEYDVPYRSRAFAVFARLVYTAPNGNYKPIQKW